MLKPSEVLARVTAENAAVMKQAEQEIDEAIVDQFVGCSSEVTVDLHMEIRELAVRALADRYRAAGWAVSATRETSPDPRDQGAAWWRVTLRQGQPAYDARD